MYDTFCGRVAAWNMRLNGLPRKAALVAATLGAAVLGTVLLPYGWPFAAAFLLSRMLEPFVRFATKGFWRVRLKRAVASAIGTALLFGVAGVLISALISRLVQELISAVKTLPQMIAWANQMAAPYLRELYARFQSVLPASLPTLLESSLGALSQSAVRWAGALSAALTSGAWSTAASIPHALLSIVLMVMGTYYMTADRARIAAFFHRTFPTGVMHRSRLISARLWRALLSQIRSQLTVSMIITVFLMAMLAVFRVPYGLLAGLFIGVADALPVLGAGLFLIPWSIASFFTGDVATGVLMAALYAGAVVIRQVLEPRIVGRNLGLYPLAAMAAMYAGYRALGFLGLLAGPVLLNLAKVVLEVDGREREKA